MADDSKDGVICSSQLYQQFKDSLENRHIYVSPLRILYIVNIHKMYKDMIALADIDSQTEQVCILLLTVSFNRKYFNNNNKTLKHFNWICIWEVTYYWNELHCIVL